MQLSGHVLRTGFPVHQIPLISRTEPEPESSSFSPFKQFIQPIALILQPGAQNLRFETLIDTGTICNDDRRAFISLGFGQCIDRLPFISSESDGGHEIPARPEQSVTNYATIRAIQIHSGAVTMNSRVLTASEEVPVCTYT